MLVRKPDSVCLLPSGKLLVLLLVPPTVPLLRRTQNPRPLYPDDLLTLLTGERFELLLLIEFDLLMILFFLAEFRACFIDALLLLQYGLQNGS